MSDLDSLTAYLTNSQFSPWADTIAIKILERYDITERNPNPKENVPCLTPSAHVNNYGSASAI